MKVSRIFASANFIVLIASAGDIATAAETMVSFVSLLDEMIDRDVLVRLPQPAYTITGANPKAEPRHMVGLDYVRLEPVR